jgi:hypothetical protein
MTAPEERPQANRVAELVPAILSFRTELLTASIGFRPDPPTQARGRAKNALVGVIKFVLHLFPNEPTLALPLNELLYGLEDLDHGKVTALLEPVRVPNNPGVPLSEDLFRATVAAGECQGGFAQHGLARCVVFGRVAGINAAKRVA